MIKKNNVSKILLVFLVIALIAVCLVSCTNKQVIEINDDGTQDGITPSGGNSNPNPQPSSGGDQQPGGDTNPNPSPDTPTQPVYTVVQPALDLGQYTINIPTNAVSIGIVSDIAPGTATSAADNDEPNIDGYLAAFDEYNQLLTGAAGRISFTITRKIYYQHETITVPVLDEFGEPILDDNNEPVTQEIYEKDTDGHYIYKLDEHDEKIPLLDENGDYIFADDCTDEEEVLGEVEIEIFQEDFGMSVLKIKVIRNFVFVCFVLPVPDECYTSNKTYTMLLANGTVISFTKYDLPTLRSDNDPDYDMVNYTNGYFTQSYVINLETDKIYPLNGVNITRLNEYGYALVDNNKSYDIRCLADDKNLSLIDISGIVNDTNTNGIIKDRNGIFYVKSKNRTTMEVNLYQNGTLPCVFYPEYIGYRGYGNPWDDLYLPHILLDKKGNAYSLIDHKLKMVVGFDYKNKTLLYSTENYGEDNKVISFNDGLIFAQNGKIIYKGTIPRNYYGIINFEDLEPDDLLDYYNDNSILIGYFWGADQLSDIYCWTDAESFIPGIIAFSKSRIELCLYTSLDYLSYISYSYDSTLSVHYPGPVPDGTVYVFNINFSFNDAILNTAEIQDITYQYDEENNYINFSLFMGKDDSFNDIYYYGSLDLEMTELSGSVELYTNYSAPSRKAALDANIITIQPLN